MNIVENMQSLADEWHYGVERKGKGHVPYIEHPRAVVAQLKAWGAKPSQRRTDKACALSP